MLNKIIIFVLVLLFSCELFAQVENDILEIDAEGKDLLNRAQIENLLKKVRRDRYHVYEDFSIDSLMIPGAVWRNYDSAGYYLKYMDWIWAIDSVSGDSVLATKIWILNHDYDSLGGGNKILARIPLEIKKDTIVTVDTLIDYVTTPVVSSYWNGSEYVYFMIDSIIRIDTIVTIDTLVTKDILRLNYIKPLIVVDDSLTVQIPARIPLVYNKDTIITNDTLIITDTLYNEYTSDFVTIIDTVLIPLDTLIKIDTLVTGDTLKLNYRKPLVVANDSLGLQLFAIAPIVFSMDTLIIIDTIINFDTLFINDTEYILTTLDTLINIDTLIVATDTISLNYKYPLYVKNDTLNVEVLAKFAKVPIVISCDTLITIDTLFDDDTFTITIDTAIVRDTLMLLYKYPLYIDNDSLTVSGKTIDSVVVPLVLKNKILSINQANTNTHGYLTSTDWNTFNNKVNTASNLGNIGHGLWYNKDANNNLTFKRINAGTNISITPSSDNSYLTISSSGGGGGGGEITTAGNIGSGVGIYSHKEGSELKFRTIEGGYNMLIGTQGSPIHTYHLHALTGQPQNLGIGYGIFKEKIDAGNISGIQDIFNFRSIAAGDNVTITPSDDDNTLIISAAGSTSSPGGGDGEVNTARNLGGMYGWYSNKFGTELLFKGVMGGNNVYIQDYGTYLSINSTGGSGEMNYINSVTSPLFSVINKNLNMQQASENTNGYLTSIDWNIFNNKMDKIPNGTAGQVWKMLDNYSQGWGTDLQGSGGEANYIKSVTSPLSVNSNGNLSIPVASGSANGYLSSTNWTTFNSKVTTAINFGGYNNNGVFLDKDGTNLRFKPLTSDNTISIVTHDDFYLKLNTIGVTGSYNIQANGSMMNFNFQDGLLKSVTPSSSNSPQMSISGFNFQDGLLKSVSAGQGQTEEWGPHIIVYEDSVEVDVIGIYDRQFIHIPFENWNDNPISYVATIENESVPNCISLIGDIDGIDRTTGTIAGNAQQQIINLRLTYNFNNARHILDSSNVVTANLVITPTNNSGFIHGDTLKIILKYYDPLLEVKYFSTLGDLSAMGMGRADFYFIPGSSLDMDYVYTRYCYIINHNNIINYNNVPIQQLRIGIAELTRFYDYAIWVGTPNDVRGLQIPTWNGVHPTRLPDGTLAEFPYPNFGSNSGGYLAAGDTMVIAIQDKRGPYGLSDNQFSYIPIEIMDSYGKGILIPVVSQGVGAAPMDGMSIDEWIEYMEGMKEFRTVDDEPVNRITLDELIHEKKLISIPDLSNLPKFELQKSPTLIEKLEQFENEVLIKLWTAPEPFPAEEETRSNKLLGHQKDVIYYVGFDGMFFNILNAAWKRR
jgi:hypothetical protein